MEKKHKIIIAALVTIVTPCATASATELGDSIDTYQNQTVTNEIHVQGRSVLATGNVTVTSSGSLTMSSPMGIDIVGYIHVQPGGWLQMNGGRQWPVVYVHDSSGNVTARQSH